MGKDRLFSSHYYRAFRVRAQYRAARATPHGAVIGVLLRCNIDGWPPFMFSLKKKP
jgi:hypothetical protein